MKYIFVRVIISLCKQFCKGPGEGKGDCPCEMKRPESVDTGVCLVVLIGTISVNSRIVFYHKPGLLG